MAPATFGLFLSLVSVLAITESHFIPNAGSHGPRYPYFPNKHMMSKGAPFYPPKGKFGPSFGKGSFGPSFGKGSFGPSFGKGSFGPSFGKRSIGGPMFGKRQFGPNFGKKSNFGGFQGKTIVKKVPMIKEVPVYERVIIDRPVYTPVVREVPVPVPVQVPQHNPGAWLPKSQNPDFFEPVAMQGPGASVDVSPGPNFNNGDFGGGVDLGFGGGVDLGNGGGVDLGLGGGVDLGVDLGLGGGVDLGLGGGIDLGLGGAPVSVPMPQTETVVTSNIQITDADHVFSNTNTASSQSHSANVNVNSNIGIHDADTVSLGQNNNNGLGGFDINNQLNGLDGLGALGLDVGVIGGGHSHGTTAGGPPVDTGLGGFADLLPGFTTGTGPVDQVATAAVHDGQAGMMVGEPVALVTLGDQLGMGAGAGTNLAHVGHGAGHV